MISPDSETEGNTTQYVQFSYRELQHVLNSSADLIMQRSPMAKLPSRRLLQDVATFILKMRLLSFWHVSLPVLLTLSLMAVVSFQIENNLFRVHRYFLKTHSRAFSDMFSIPPAREGEGRSDLDPIRLECTKSIDFARLLSLFYPK